MSLVRGGGWAALVVALIGLAAVVLPFDPMFLSFSIDGGFGATLHYEAATRQSAGTHLISTFGPLGFAYYPVYLPETFGRLLAVSALFAAVLGWGLAWIGWAAWASPWGAAVAIAACAPFVGTPDVRFLLLPILAVCIELPRPRAPAALRIALGAAIGLSALVKTTFFTAAVLALAPLILRDLLSRRALPLLALSAAGAAVVAWLGLGLSAAEWLAYLDWSTRDVGPGYSAAMQLPTAPALVVHAVAVAVATLLAAVLLARRGHRTDWWAPGLAMAGLLFLLFKAGLVRADVHVFITSFGLLVCGIVLAVLWGPSPRRIAAGALLVGALPGALLWHAVAVQSAPTSRLYRAVGPAEIVDRLSRTADLIWGDALARAHAQHAAEMRAAVPLPPLSGPVDVYSYEQSVLLASGLTFRPRPVFQSYMAYTPRLARANAEFLAGDGAPRWIVLQPETIDRRFPAIDDAAAWPILLTHYRAEGRVGSYALLERRATALSWRLLPLGRLHTATDTPIEVPPGLVWARIDVGETLADRVAAALFAAPYVFMDVTFANGAPWRYRLVPAVARDGFLLSPLIGATPDLIALMQSGAEALRARDLAQLRVRVESPFGNPWEPRTVDVELFQVQIGADEASAAAP